MAQAILVIDDNPMVRDVVQLMLNASGFRVVSAEDGQAGLRAYDSQVFEAAIIDVDMPGIDGIEVCRKLHERAAAANRPLAAWIMTGVVRHDIAARAAEAGALGVLAKPFTKHQLLACFPSRVFSEAEHPLAG